MGWILRTFTGLIIALLILSTGGYFVARHLVTQLTAKPPRPAFPNDDPNYLKKVGKKPTGKADLKAAPDAKEAKSTKEKEAKPLPPGAFEGKVKQPIGLMVRDTPEMSAGASGGVDYNERITVLEASSDGAWQKIRYGSNREGWVKGGNIEKVNP
jgi:hypothetical protein